MNRHECDWFIVTLIDYFYLKNPLYFALVSITMLLMHVRWLNIARTLCVFGFPSQLLSRGLNEFSVNKRALSTTHLTGSCWTFLYRIRHYFPLRRIKDDGKSYLETRKKWQENFHLPFFIHIFHEISLMLCISWTVVPIKKIY